ncbi:MAG: hypothetical protein K2M42_06065 [Oscillospiraceae bacterium]|nr:hypothetical protein [Oscillospiraceae bacterium]
MESTTARKSNKIYCYIGPNIRGHLHTGQVFRGEKEDILKAHAELVQKHPLVKSLIIPGEALPAARLRVKEAGTAHYANYQKLSRELLEAAQEKVMPEYEAYQKEAVNNA